MDRTMAALQQRIIDAGDIHRLCTGFMAILD